MKTISFAAGIFITYIFLHMFPLMYQSNELLAKMSLVSALFGFGIFHIIERRTSKHSVKERANQHFIGLFIYNFVVGIVFADIIGINLLNGLLFFIPIAIFGSITSIAMKEINKIEQKHIGAKFAFSISTLLGIAISALTEINSFIQFSLIGFITGSLFYIIIIDAIPKGKSGKPLYFALGLVIYTLVIVVSWIA